LKKLNGVLHRPYRVVSREHVVRFRRTLTAQQQLLKDGMQAFIWYELDVTELPDMVALMRQGWVKLAFQAYRGDDLRLHRIDPRDQRPGALYMARLLPPYGRFTVYHDDDRAEPWDVNIKDLVAADPDSFRHLMHKHNKKPKRKPEPAAASTLPNATATVSREVNGKWRRRRAKGKHA